MKLFIEITDDLIAKVEFHYELTDKMMKSINKKTDYPDDIVVPCFPEIKSVSYYNASEKIYAQLHNFKEKIEAFKMQNGYPTITELREYLNNK